MASNQFDDTSSERSKPRETIVGFFPNLFRAFFSYVSRFLLTAVYFVMSKERDSTVSQFERAQKETARILKDATGSSRGYSAKSNSSWSKRRVPLLYRINDNNSILIILQGDITKTKIDAIVNAANEHMTGGGGVDGVIHRAAGDDLYRACKAHKEVSRGVRLPTGHSRILLSYDMSHTTYYIINTAGPMYYRREAEKCAEELFSCYKTSLALADLYDLESIGYTAISCGIFGYPADDGADVALRAVDQHAASVPVVVFVLWDDHIYDAWERKAQELKLTPYDPNMEYQEKSMRPSSSKLDEKQPSKKFNPAVTDLSTPDGPIEKADEDTKPVIIRLPSVPHGAPDTHDTEDMDHESAPVHDKPPLTTGNSMQLADTHLTDDDPPSNPDSVRLGVSEEGNQSIDDKEKTETNANDSQPSSKPETSGEPKRKHTE